MNRRRLLQTLGAAGAATIFPFGRNNAGRAAIVRLQRESLLAGDGCILILQDGYYLIIVENLRGDLLPV
jgi:hypothetical protein